MKDLILTLDIDDCLYPSNQTWLGTTNDNLDILKLNMVRIKMILELTEHLNAKIFITSSWSTILEIKNNSLIFKKSYNPFLEEINVLKVLKQYTDGYIIGLSCGNRRTDIKELLIEGYKVISFDDMDLGDIRSRDYLYLKVAGFITNEHGYFIKCFIDNKKPKLSDCGKIDTITKL